VTDVVAVHLNNIVSTAVTLNECCTVLQYVLRFKGFRTNVLTWKLTSWVSKSCTHVL